MAKAEAGYPRLKELVDRAIATSEEECIVWKCKSKTPYPQLSVTDKELGIKNKITRINRAVAEYVLKRQLRPKPKEEVVDHHCREKKCINPYHLFVMTPRENNEKKHWSRILHDDRLIISAWLKPSKYSNQTKNQKRCSVIQFLEFINNDIKIEDGLKTLHHESSDEISNIVQRWNTHLLKKVDNKSLTPSTVRGHVSYVRNLLNFVKDLNLIEILQREEESQVKQLNVVAQAKEESSKKRAILKSKGITDEAQLTAMQTECNECNELREEIHRLKNENESLYSKLVEKDLEIERYQLIQSRKNSA